MCTVGQPGQAGKVEQQQTSKKSRNPHFFEQKKSRNPHFFWINRSRTRHNRVEQTRKSRNPHFLSKKSRNPHFNAHDGFLLHVEVTSNMRSAFDAADQLFALFKSSVSRPRHHHSPEDTGQFVSNGCENRAIFRGVGHARRVRWGHYRRIWPNVCIYLFVHFVFVVVWHSKNKRSKQMEIMYSKYESCTPSFMPKHIHCTPVLYMMCTMSYSRHE